jgi:hypothetical protein
MTAWLKPRPSEAVRAHEDVRSELVWMRFFAALRMTRRRTVARGPWVGCRTSGARASFVAISRALRPGLTYAAPPALSGDVYANRRGIFVC